MYGNSAGCAYSACNTRWSRYCFIGGQHQQVDFAYHLCQVGIGHFPRKIVSIFHYMLHRTGSKDADVCRKFRHIDVVIQQRVFYAN